MDVDRARVPNYRPGGREDIKDVLLKWEITPYVTILQSPASVVDSKDILYVTASRNTSKAITTPMQTKLILSIGMMKMLTSKKKKKPL